jgi:hypothetical protein
MSSSQAIRLQSGGMVHVRSGVVQGIGPQGPTGATGPRGETGDVGPQGIPGPTGSVSEISSQFTAQVQSAGLTSVTSNYPTAYGNLVFATVVRDELNAQTSTVNFRLTAGSDFNVVAEVRFFKQTAVNGSGFRAVQAVYNSVVIGEVLVPANVAVDTIVRLPVGVRSTSTTDVLNIKIAHNDTATLNVSGRLWINATGPGVQGPQGVQGIQGDVGPLGPQGPIGPAGSIVTPTTTIADIGGTNPA